MAKEALDLNMLSLDQQIFERIKKAQNILITFNNQWHGDAVASALALFLFIKKLDKQVEVIAEKTEQGNLFNFLPHYDSISKTLENLRKFIITLDTTNSEVGKVKYRSEKNFLEFIIYPKNGFFSHENIKSKSGEFKYDLIITVDTPDLEMLGKIYEKDAEFFYQVPIINIDHHSNNEEYGQVNKIELTAIATSEILFNLLHEYSKDLIDDNIATCLLAGIISKTKNYKTQNITPQALSISSQLITMGARREQIVAKLYRSRTLNILKLWGRVLARLTSSLENKLVWSVLTTADFAKTNTSEEDLREVIDELIINIPQSKVVVIIHEQNESPENSSTKAIIYTMKNINALDLVKKWNPDGSRDFASITVAMKPQEAETEIIKHIKEGLAKITA